MAQAHTHLEKVRVGRGVRRRAAQLADRVAERLGEPQAEPGLAELVDDAAVARAQRARDARDDVVETEPERVEHLGLGRRAARREPHEQRQQRGRHRLRRAAAVVPAVGVVIAAAERQPQRVLAAVDEQQQDRVVARLDHEPRERAALGDERRVARAQRVLGRSGRDGVPRGREQRPDLRRQSIASVK